MIGKIIGLLISIGLIIAGFSGEFVLRGTDSSTALIIAGVVFLIFDIVGIVRETNKDKDSDTQD
jgi:hypothetical protein